MTSGQSPAGDGRAPSRERWWHLLLLAPFVGLLWPALYAKDAPRLGGFPFFYWYQFLWVLIGVVVTAVVYLATTPRNGGSPGGAASGSPELEAGIMPVWPILRPSRRWRSG